MPKRFRRGGGSDAEVERPKAPRVAPRRAPSPGALRRERREILKARVTATFNTSLEVEVEVFSEETLTGIRRMTSRAYLTFVSIDREGRRLPIPALILETKEDRDRAAAAEIRRAERLKARRELEERCK